MSFSIKHKMSCFQRDCGGKKQRKQINTVYRKLIFKKINILLNLQTTSSDFKVPRFILLYIVILYMLFYLSAQIPYIANGQWWTSVRTSYLQTLWAIPQF